MRWSGYANKVRALHDPAGREENSRWLTLPTLRKSSLYAPWPSGCLRQRCTRQRMRRGGFVTCDSCGEKFFIGRNRIAGSRISAQECAKRLDALLGADHRRDGTHEDSYEIPD